MCWPRFRFNFLRLSKTGQANLSAGLLLLGAMGIPWSLSGGQTAGVYRGAVRPHVPVVPMGVPQATAGTSPSAGKSSSQSTVANATPIEGRLALQMKRGLLHDAQQRLQTQADYTAIFTRQERVGGQLLPAETVDLKVRHAPFSVYMRWIDVDEGQEVLFVDGQNDGKMHVKKGGSVGGLVPTVKLDPTGSLAMAKSRHPVTEAGLLNLVQLMLKFVERDLDLESGVECRMLPDTKIDGRLCYCLQTAYANPQVDDHYRCSLAFFDQQTGLPLCVQNYGWPEECGVDPKQAQELSDKTLVEAYTYSSVCLTKPLKPVDFDYTNREYRFVRQ